jgi:uncharacterized protein (DUF697 family)
VTDVTDQVGLRGLVTALHISKLYVQFRLEFIMSNTFRRFAPFVVAGAAALAIAAAPAASAEASEPHLACVYQSEGNSQCESPGNAQLTATPQTVPNTQQYPFLFGGPLLVFHHGGGHGMGTR